MVNAKFDPGACRSYADLPQVLRQEFKLVTEGFVRKTAIDDPEAALEEALITWNEFTLSELVEERRRDLLTTLNVVGSALTGDNAAASAALDRQRDVHQQALNGLPRQAEWIRAVIARYRVWVPVDMILIEDLISFDELWGPGGRGAQAVGSEIGNEREYVIDGFCDGRKTTQRHPSWRGLRTGPEGGICDTSTEAQSRHLVAYWSAPSLRFFTLDIFFTSISRRLADARSRYGSA